MNIAALSALLPCVYGDCMKYGRGKLMNDQTLNAPKFNFILLDADGTLFDFDIAEAIALEKVFCKYGFIYNEDIYNEYRAINLALWDEFEKGKVGKAYLQVNRFARLLHKFNDKADAGQFNLAYLDMLSENGHLIEGALDICKELSQCCTLVIVTNGIARAQRGRLANSEIKPYISHIIVSEDAGYQKPHVGFFEYAFDICKIEDKKTALIVGDSLSADIKGGLNFGISTCWYNPSSVQPGDFKADYEIKHLSDLLKIVL